VVAKKEQDKSFNIRINIGVGMTNTLERWTVGLLKHTEWEALILTTQMKFSEFDGINYIQEIPFRQANSSSAKQEILCCLWTPTVN